MNFLISDTFTDSLARLTGDEQKAVKTTAFDLQVNPASPGMQFHRIDKVKDKNFWSIRVSRDIRLIVHKTDDCLLLCYVNHHDPAYHWAARRRLQVHPKTGAAQLVELRETVQEVIVPKFVDERPKTRRRKTNRLIFDQFSDEELLNYGVPAEWLPDVRKATEDSLLALTDHLPAEAAEALLELATGGKPRSPQKATTNPFEHPDAQRRFRIMSNLDELARALEFPWEKWTVFLHPEQRQLVENTYRGPVRISGSAGTGKTIVALHRAVHVARTNPDSRVLLTTFSDALATALQTRLFRLVSNEPRLAERIDVLSLNAVARRLYQLKFGRITIADFNSVRTLLQAASREVTAHTFSDTFLASEWRHVVDAWQLSTWDDYRSVARPGRKTRLSETKRTQLWSIFEKLLKSLADQELVTESAMFFRLASLYADEQTCPFDFIVVDEAQDLSVSQLRFLSAICQGRPDGLFFTGDLGQRIFQESFSWKSLGVDIRGRSRTLRVNYRTSHQIRQQADLLLAGQVSDADGNTQDRTDTVSIFNGPIPCVQVFNDHAEEQARVAEWLREQTAAGVCPQEIGVFVRSEQQLDRAITAVRNAGLKFNVLDEHQQHNAGTVAVSTMHLAKGLEFRSVAVMACDDEVIPLQERIESVGDDSDLKEVYDTERHLLYVACTRARDVLLVTGTDPASEFLEDMSG